jgi:hypothetical protein
MLRINPKRLVDTPRKRVVTEIVALALVICSAALAAWLIGTLNGQSGGRVGQSQQIGAITLTPIYTSNPAEMLYPGSSAPGQFSVDNPTGHTVTISSVSAGSFGVQPNCGDGGTITFTPTGLVGLSFPPGNTPLVSVPNFWHATAALPEACQGAQLTLGLSGTTTGQ